MTKKQPWDNHGPSSVWQSRIEKLERDRDDWKEIAETNGDIIDRLRAEIDSLQEQTEDRDDWPVVAIDRDDWKASAKTMVDLIYRLRAEIDSLKEQIEDRDLEEYHNG